MVRLRLQRFGAKRRPYYRVVAADKRKARNGRFIEQLGTYDPKQEPPLIRLDFDRVEYWLDNGAKASDTVWSFVKRMRQEADNVVDLSEEGADEAKREELRRQREEAINERRRELAESVDLQDEHTGTGQDEEDQQEQEEQSAEAEASEEDQDDEQEQEAQEEEAPEEGAADAADQQDEADDEDEDGQEDDAEQQAAESDQESESDEQADDEDEEE